MSMYIIDTDVIVDHLRGYRSIDETIKQHFPNDPAPDLHVSRITFLELLMSGDGGRMKNRLLILGLQDYCTVADIDPYIELAADIIRQRKFNEVRLQYRFIPDGIIAATAIANHLILVSRNKRDFSWLPGLNARFV